MSKRLPNTFTSYLGLYYEESPILPLTVHLMLLLFGENINSLFINSFIEWIFKSLLACTVVLCTFISRCLVYTCKEFFEALLFEWNS